MGPRVDVGTGGRTMNGWTRPIFKQFLDYLDTQNVRALAVWSEPPIEDSWWAGVKPMPPTINETCTHWMLDEIRAWRQRDTPAAARAV